MADERVWSWWAIDLDGPEDTPDSYQINEPTRSAAIAAAQREWPAEWVAIIEATQEGPFKLRMFDEGGDCARTEHVFDWFLDDNSSRWGEDGPELFIDHADLAKVLNDVFEAYLRANLDALQESAWSFTETRNAEVMFMGRVDG